jgi:hypothetical protein
MTDTKYRTFTIRLSEDATALLGKLSKEHLCTPETLLHDAVSDWLGQQLTFKWRREGALTRVHDHV